jgi:3-oxoacyl-[acyl-carrier protein] reductase
MTRALAAEMGPFGINVNCVTPGLTANEGTRRVYPAELFENTVKQQIVKRSLVSEDIVGAVLFLCTSDSDMIQGQSINIDGGLTFP